MEILEKQDVFRYLQWNKNEISIIVCIHFGGTTGGKGAIVESKHYAVPFLNEMK